MFQLLTAPFTVLFTICKAINTFAEAANDLASASRAFTRTAKGNAESYEEESSILRNQRIEDMRKDLASAKRKKQPYVRQSAKNTSFEIQ